MDAPCDSNGSASAKPQHLWKPGQSGNPIGRKKGSRNKLSEDFLAALSKDFEQHGARAIEEVRTKRPHDYHKTIASLLPRGLELDIAVDATPEFRMELANFARDYVLVQQAMERIGVEPLLIEAVTIDEEPN